MQTDLDLILEFIASNPGCSTDELADAVGVPENRMVWVASLHRLARSHRYGQLEDGRWFTSDAHPVIAACVASNSPSPGTTKAWRYLSTPLSNMDPELREWGLRNT